MEIFNKERKRKKESHQVGFMFVTVYLVTVQRSNAAARGRERIKMGSFQKAGLLRQFCGNQVRDTVEN